MALLHVSIAIPDTTKVEAVVDADIKAFDTYFQGLKNDPLSKLEFAIIKTYLAWKLLGDKHLANPPVIHAVAEDGE